MFDGLGIHENLYWQLWNQLGAVVVDIFWDPPLRFHPMLDNPNMKKHILFCPDFKHIEYVKRYFPQVEHIGFLPHAGTPDVKKAIPYKERGMDLLFSGTYYRPDSYQEALKREFDGTIYQVYMLAYERLLENFSLTVDEAVLEAISLSGLGELSVDSVKAFMRGAVDLDWRIRMAFREKVVSSLVREGVELHVLGRGWHNHPDAGNPHLHILTEERIPFARTLDYMGNARINLNVMPWFKAGTHDRVFNSMLRRSVLLTDPSSFLEKVFSEGKEIVYYSLDKLDELPDIINRLLKHPDEAEQIAENGYQKAQKMFTWKEYADQILGELEKFGLT